jgi:hypothetical protein
VYENGRAGVQARIIAAPESHPMLRKTILGFALCWAGFAFLLELSHAIGNYDARDRRAPVPANWRFGIPQVEVLAQGLGEARALLPAGSVVAFASRPGPGDAEFFRWRWAAYFLAGCDVVPWDPAAAAAEGVGYVVSHRRDVGDPRLELVRPLTAGRLYRVRRP